MKTHTKLFPIDKKTYKNLRSSSSKHRTNFYLEKIDENKSNYISIFKPEVRPALRSEHNGRNMNDLFRLVSWDKTRCSQECMVINYGKLISEEN